MNSAPCFCGSGREYKDCCRPYIIKEKLPSAPLALMRSRYTAFCLKDADYLVATLAPENRRDEVQLRAELAHTMAATKWVGLQVLDSGQDAGNGGAEPFGYVEFAAFFAQEGTLGQIHEKSRFICREAVWYYLDGSFLPPVSIGRNAPCICGSGKKFKRCHGKDQ